MVSKLQTYQALGTGLTQQDRRFCEALAELSHQPTDFYNHRRSAYNRLNHALAGSPIDLARPVSIVGLLDESAGTLTMAQNGKETSYNLDELDPRYLAVINQARPNKHAKQLPITEMAAQMLNELTPEVAASDKPTLEPYSLSGSREVLKQSFANEMVLQNALQTFVTDHDLDGTLERNRDKLIHLVDHKSFEASFTRGLKDLETKARVAKPARRMPEASEPVQTEPANRASLEL